MSLCVLFRRGVDDEDRPDHEAAVEVFGAEGVPATRSEVPAGSLVIGRFSVLPFYRELELDLQSRGSRLVNSWRQHQFIADMREWCECLGELTPRLYARLQDLPETGRFVVKGETNSRKHQWATHMFASSRREAAEVAARLMDDSLIGQQQIYARDYVELVTYLVSGNGLPITDEYRLFVAGREVVAGGYYWASFVSDIVERDPTFRPERLSPNNVPADLVREAIRRIGDRASFYTLDVAKKRDGSWVVIEINDGQMAGLSGCDPRELYTGLKRVYEVR
ncbi:MAG: ATP-grasp domain-containing protein [Myxococcaceae bacterium]|nr:ATP-grasp domain-containing protein [Myxococcaceae bacterium]